MRRSKWATGTLAVVVAAAVLSTGIAVAKKGGGGGGGGESGASQKYSIVKLDDAGGLFVGSPSSGAFDVNKTGNVVGQVALADGSDDSVAAFWQVNGTKSEIFPLIGGTWAFGLNDSNEIVGQGSLSVDPPKVAGFYWSSPTAQPEPLPPLSEGLASVAYAINGGGVICGYARELVVAADGTPIGSTDVAVVWRLTYPDGELQIVGPVALPTLDDRSQAYAINDNDTAGSANVVGVFMASNFLRTAAAQWTVQSHADGTLSVDPNPVLLEVGEAAAFAVNNLGMSCGQALLGFTEPKAQLWSGENGLTLLDPDSSPGTAGRPLHNALDVNDSGVIVGAAGVNATYYDAVVWPSAAEQPILLNKFLPKRNSPFAFLQEATAINEAGMIVGVGGNGADRLPFLAIPK